MPLGLADVREKFRVILPEIYEVKALLRAAEQAKEKSKALSLLRQLNELERLKIQARRREEELQYGTCQLPLAETVCKTLNCRSYFPSCNVCHASTGTKLCT